MAFTRRRFPRRLFGFFLISITCGTLVACNDFEKGKAAGYQEGLSEGQRKAYVSARNQGRAEGYGEGKAAGLAEGETAGYERGVREGEERGRFEGQKAGREEGYKAGLKEGWERGQAAGRAESQSTALEKGRKEGEAKGQAEGREKGLTEGEKQGYMIGYEAGKRDGAREKSIALTKHFAWRLGLPIVAVAIMVGLTLNLLGWKKVSDFSDSLSALSEELEVKKRMSRTRMTELYERRKSMSMAAPDVWFIVASLLVFAALEYKLEEEVAIFLALIGAGLFSTVYSVRSSAILVARVSLFWLAAAAFVLDMRHAGQVGWLREPAAVAILSMGIYFLARALFGAGWNDLDLDASAGDWESGFIVAAIFGSTLQIAWLLTLFVGLLAPGLLQSSAIGSYLSDLLATIRRLSPTSWIPVGLSALALLLAAALRMSRDRFVPTRYEDLLPKPKSPLFEAMAILPKLPSWLLINIFRFLMHYLRQVGRVLISFGANYFARLVFLVAALFIPMVCLLEGHTLLASASSLMESHIAGNEVPIFSLVKVVLFLVAASLLWFTAVALLPVEFEATDLKEAVGRIVSRIKGEGAPAAFSAGIGYATFIALLVLSLPLVCLMPGAKEPGFFVWLCATVLGTAMVAVLVASFFSSRRHSSQAMR